MLVRDKEAEHRSINNLCLLHLTQEKWAFSVPFLACLVRCKPYHTILTFFETCLLINGIEHEIIDAHIVSICQANHVCESESFQCYRVALWLYIKLILFI